MRFVDPNFVKPKCKVFVADEGGNDAFSIIGRVRSTLMSAGFPACANEFYANASHVAVNDDLVTLVMDYVEIT